VHGRGSRKSRADGEPADFARARLRGRADAWSQPQGSGAAGPMGSGLLADGFVQRAIGLMQEEADALPVDAALVTLEVGRISAAIAQVRRLDPHARRFGDALL